MINGRFAAFMDRTYGVPLITNSFPKHPKHRRTDMIVLGIVLLVLGALLNVSILYTLGAILVVVGVVLFLLGSTGRAVGGRRHYY